MTLRTNESTPTPMGEDRPGRYDASVRDRLLFRRQFILGPRFIEDLPAWRKLRLTDSHCLTAHPDLSVQQVAHGGLSLTLLGYVLDPGEPQARDLDILQSLLRALQRRGRVADLLERTHDLAGRWSLIVNDGQRLRMLHDVCGYRQVYYTDTAHTAELWFASQPGLIAETLQLRPDPAALEFLRAYAATGGGGGWPGKEYWWPGDTSAYRAIKRLLPNHYVDLHTGVPQRFWPDRPLGRLSLEEGVRRNAQILQGVVAAAANRFPLALAMTAGKDSRLMLAASRAVRNSLYCFTLIYWNLHEGHADIAIPARLLPRLGLDHHVIQCPTQMDPEFGALYRRNVTTAHEAYGTIAQGLHEHYPQERVAMKGTAPHIVMSRRNFRLELPGGVVDARALVRKGKIGEHPFAIRAAEAWLSGAREIHDVDALDLFYWENKEGSWQATSQTECDIAQEALEPCACRNFFANALAIDEKYRRKPNSRLHLELIRALWPEVLSEPFNPHQRRPASYPLKAMAKDLLVGMRLYHVARR